ncbi:hypothetical protein HDU83_005497 [Entophlyctis luteolus]|nr:hypothetical protein HDU83_005497 [Entophlyctis luteolus]KAJ3391490.1 hypothetical protein HDU84_005865 [Entophlyctis sp. JEL0112]
MASGKVFAIGLSATAAYFGYLWLTAFQPSRPSRKQIAASGGSLFELENDRFLEYFEFGDTKSSRVLLCFHGAQTTGNLFVILEKWALASKIRIVAPTLPGFGLTPSLPPTMSGFQVWVRDVEHLLEHLHIDRFYMLGTSLGSIYAQIFATTCQMKWKNQIQNICLYVGFAPFTPGEYDPLEGSILQVFGELRSRPLFKRMLERLLLIPILRWTSPRNGDTLRSIKWQWEGLYNSADIIYVERSFAGLKELAVGGQRRVLIVSGSNDIIAPPHNQKRLCELITGAEFVSYEGAHERAILEPELLAKHLELILE